MIIIILTGNCCIGSECQFSLEGSENLQKMEKLSIILLAVIITVLFHPSSPTYVPCSPKDFGQGSVACVCNQTYCDGFKDIPQLKPYQYVVYTSTKGGMRFNETFGFSNHTQADDHEADLVEIHIDASKTYQKIFGFGGAFTGK